MDRIMSASLYVGNSPRSSSKKMKTWSDAGNDINMRPQSQEIDSSDHTVERFDSEELDMSACFGDQDVMILMDEQQQTPKSAAFPAKQ